MLTLKKLTRTRRMKGNSDIISDMIYLQRHLRFSPRRSLGREDDEDVSKDDFQILFHLIG